MAFPTSPTPWVKVLVDPSTMITVVNLEFWLLRVFVQGGEIICIVNEAINIIDFHVSIYVWDPSNTASGVIQMLHKGSIHDMGSIYCCHKVSMVFSSIPQHSHVTRTVNGISSGDHIYILPCHVYITCSTLKPFFRNLYISYTLLVSISATEQK